jgi:hypothetical protein
LVVNRNQIIPLSLPGRWKGVASTHMLDLEYQGYPSPPLPTAAPFEPNLEIDPVFSETASQPL